MLSFVPPEITAAGTNTLPTPAQTVPLPKETLASTMRLTNNLLKVCFLPAFVSHLIVTLLSLKFISNENHP
jgi:hypothetical protein